MSEYVLVKNDRTSGWNGAGQGVNSPNSFGMLPIEVAAQAGDSDEFREIWAHPEFDPAVGNPHRFAEVGRMIRDYQPGAEERYARLKLALRDYGMQFPYNEARKCRVRQPEPAVGAVTLPVLATTDSLAARAAKERFLNEHAANARPASIAADVKAARPASPRMRG